MTFGNRLRESRTTKKMTQRQLADLVGAKHNSISDWENDKSKPDPDTIELLCGVLGITPNYLLNTNSDDLSPIEKEIIKKYRALDMHGKEMVDMVLEKEDEHTTAKVVQFPDTRAADYLITNAAHARTDIEVPEDTDTTDNKFMDNDDLWK